MERIKLIFRQFFFMDALKFCIAESFRKFFNKHAYFAYSQFGEDQFLMSYFQYKTNGKFVEVGSNHPFKFSNTARLYFHGWRGISIDANSNLVSIHKKKRYKDEALNYLVSDNEDKHTFYTMNYDAVSTADASLVKKWQESWEVVDEERMISKKLDTILKSKIDFINFDLLMIDVEGFDFKVLQSINLNLYKPKLIVIEIHDFDIQNSSEHPIVKYLANYNYKWIGFLALNAYFEKIPGL